MQSIKKGSTTVNVLALLKKTKFDGKKNPNYDFFYRSITAIGLNSEMR